MYCKQTKFVISAHDIYSNISIDQNDVLKKRTHTHRTYKNQSKQTFLNR